MKIHQVNQRRNRRRRCQKCGGPMRVEKTMHSPTHIIRYTRCTQCNARVKTVEKKAP